MSIWKKESSPVADCNKKTLSLGEGLVKVFNVSTSLKVDWMYFRYYLFLQTKSASHKYFAKDGAQALNIIKGHDLLLGRVRLNVKATLFIERTIVIP